VQAYPPAKRSLVDLTNALLLGLYSTKLKKTCLFFMLKELHIKTRSKQCWLIS